MSKIIINEMSYHYSEYFNSIFNKVDLVLDTEWRLGLIGRNGRGKTTFLKLIQGDLQPSKGSINKSVTIEYFPYLFHSNYNKTIDVMKENIGMLKSMEDRMDTIIKNNDESKFDEYQQILNDYIQADGYEMESKIKRELNHMNLAEELLERDYELLSGGEKTKIMILTLFLRKNAFVLLDEPTNHLDIEGKRAITEYLKQKTGFIVVSHDRQFLDDVTDHILSINKADISLEKGNYSSWKENKDKSELYEQRTKIRLEKEIIDLEKRSVNNRNWAAIAEKEKNPYATHNRGNGSRAAKFMRQAKTSEQTIRDNIQEKKNLLKNYEFASELLVEQNTLEVTTLVYIKKLNFRYTDKYILENFSLKINTGDRIWIRGRNGCGKSTLLHILGRKIPTEQIVYYDNLNISEAYQETLWKNGLLNDLITDTFWRNKFINICKNFDLDEDTLSRPIETFSDGEKRKIDIARALSMENELLLLDEPLNYMDVYFREQLEKAILTYKPTIVFVEHDERFGNNVANKIITL